MLSLFFPILKRYCYVLFTGKIRCGIYVMSSMLAGKLELLVGKTCKKKNKWKDWISLPLLNHGK